MSSDLEAEAAHPELKPSMTPAAYMEKVARAKEYIAAGDIFQVVLSQRFEAPFTLPSFSLYRALRRVNPSPFLYYLNFDGFAVAGSSPEILVRVRDGAVTIRPIAGTRPRGATPEEDKALAAELLADRQGARRASDAARSRPQRRGPRGRGRQRARHRLFFLEYYSQVMHIVSNVEGRLDPRSRCDRRADGGLSRRHRVGRAEGARHGDHRRARRRRSAGPTPAASAISPPMARWIPASCCAPRW